MDKQRKEVVITETNIEEYKACIAVFGEKMLVELINNHDKGGRVGPEGWINYDMKLFFNEIYYHTGKLQAAIKNNDSELIKEYAADIANLALMVADKTYYLTSIPFNKLFHDKNHKART